MVMLAYSMLRKFDTIRNVNLKGMNPSKTCITDSSHIIFANMLLALEEYTNIRAGLQILSSLMIDAVFLHLTLNW